MVKSPTTPSPSCDCELDLNCENPNCEDPDCASNPKCSENSVDSEPDSDCRETKYLSSSSGTTEKVDESCEEAGSYYWKAR